MKNSFGEIARKFRITKHEAYRELFSHSNKINFKLIETESTVFNIVSDVIYETKDILLSDKYIGSIVDVKQDVPLKKRPYIYYLFDENVLIYIGKTNNLLQRLSTHQDYKIFDGVSYMEIDRSVMDIAEVLNIYYYQPIQNIQGKSHLEFYKLVLCNCDFS